MSPFLSNNLRIFTFSNKNCHNYQILIIIGDYNTMVTVSELSYFKLDIIHNSMKITRREKSIRDYPDLNNLSWVHFLKSKRFAIRLSNSLVIFSVECVWWCYKCILLCCITTLWCVVCIHCVCRARLLFTSVGQRDPV